MAAYRRVYGFRHLWTDCRGPGSALEACAHSEYGTNLYLYPRLETDRVVCLVIDIINVDFR